MNVFLRPKWTRVFSLSLALLVVTSAPAQAGKRDFEVAARMLHMIQGVPTGDRVLGIVVDPGVAESATSAEEISGMIGSGTSYGETKLTAKTISPSEVGSVDIVYVPTGMGQHHAAIAAAAQAGNIITMTNDPACVEAQSCVISIVRKSRTEILWSRSAAEAASAGLGETMKALVDERP